MAGAHRIGLWLRREVLDRVLFHGRPLVCALAFVWRRLLFRTTFVAITGSLARAAARSSDMAVFVGESAAYGGRRAVEAGMASAQVRDFRTLEEAAHFLKSELGTGDLLLLKGRTADHATRIFHALRGPIRCWKTDCRRRIPCDRCWELGARLGR